MRGNAKLILIFIVIATIGGALFVYPTGFGERVRPWRLGLDLVGGSHLVYEVDLRQVTVSDQESVLNGLRDVIERRVNLFGVSEPQVFLAESGESRQLVVELAGIKNVSDAIRIIGETPLLDFRTVTEHEDGTPVDVPEEYCQEFSGKKYCFIPTQLSGRYITSAYVSFDETTQRPQVALSFNAEGSGLFEKLTGENIGKPIAIFLDHELIELPTVQQKIAGGQAVITGSFTLEEARKLVERFNAGALPAPIVLVNQQTVSATLGANSLAKMIIAGVVGTVLVMVFMLLYYGMLGVYASIALLMYVVLTLGLFKLIPITMTLAGLAGFVLSIGMAVDANILIFERMREERAAGAAERATLEEGFRRAWPSIRDSNVSTIITALILYYFTSSFVQGFALTLLVGVLTSMVSAIFITRTLLRVFFKVRATGQSS